MEGCSLAGCGMGSSILPIRLGCRVPIPARLGGSLCTCPASCMPPFIKLPHMSLEPSISHWGPGPLIGFPGLPVHSSQSQTDTCLLAATPGLVQAADRYTRSLLPPLAGQGGWDAGRDVARRHWPPAIGAFHEAPGDPRRPSVSSRGLADNSRISLQPKGCPDSVLPRPGGLRARTFFTFWASVFLSAQWEEN